MTASLKFDHAQCWHVADGEVEKLCRYVTDDGTVAGYFGISRQRVAAIRAHMRIPEDRRFLAKRSEPESAADGSAQPLKAYNLAANGSAMLLERCNMLFRRFADRHRLDFETARRLQLDGYRP
jgi:hypothetical protein